MEIAEFQRILNIGLGRAIVHLQKNPASRSLYRDAILYACLNNTVYDAQVEGGRGEYLSDVIKFSDDPAYYRDQVLQEFSRLKPSEDWTTEQFFDLAVEFAEQGYEQARELLYRKRKACWDAQYLTGSHQLVYLDGFKGFLFAIDPLNRQRYPEKDAWTYSYLLGDLEEITDVDEDLATEYRNNPQLRRFILAIRKSRNYSDKHQKAARRKKARMERMSYNEIKEYGILRYSKEIGYFGLRTWGEKASVDDLNLAAADFLAEENPQVMLAYIDMFQTTPFPLELSKLLRLAEFGDQRVERDLLAIRAINALENIAHPDVRELALRMIEQGNRTGRAVGLLQNNFEENDWKYIEQITERYLEAEDLHNLDFSVRNIVKLHPSEDALGTLLNLYEYGPCSACRYRFVEYLHQLNKIPDWMIEECQYDSNPNLRAWARRGFASLEEKH